MARITREKSNLRHITDWPAADRFVRVIGDERRLITAARETARDDINEIKRKLAKEIKPLQEDVVRLIASLELFADSHAGDFGKARSRKLNFGMLGWRKSTSIHIKKTTFGLIKEVFSRAKAAACIRVKEEIDKEALAKLTDEELVDVGARRRCKDVFSVEPASPKAVDYTE